MAGRLAARGRRAVRTRGRRPCGPRGLAPWLDDDGRARIEQLQADALEPESDELTAGDAVALPEGPARDHLFSALSGNRDAAIKVVRDALLEDVEVCREWATTLVQAG